MLSAWIKAVARQAGFNVTRTGHLAGNYLVHPPRTMFDQVLLHCFRDLRGLRFIQIGANDGQQADPLLRYLAPCAWEGLMLEPSAIHFAALRARHAANPRLALWPVAVDTAAGTRELFELAAAPGLPAWVRGVGSFDRGRVVEVARSVGLPETAVRAVRIETVTWDRVWGHFGNRRCDLLVLDTEGHDLVLLRHAGLAAHRPRVVHFEHACVAEADYLAFLTELRTLGYEICTEGPDTTAWLAT